MAVLFRCNGCGELVEVLRHYLCQKCWSEVERNRERRDQE